MARRKKRTVLPDAPEEVARSQGEFKKGPKGEEHEFHLGRATTPEKIRERLAIATVYCTEAEMWINGTPSGNKSEGVAKSALRDALVRIAEVWLGKPASEALAMVRKMIADEETGEGKEGNHAQA